MRTPTRVLVLLWALVTLARFAAPATGLRARYFSNNAWSGDAARTTVDALPSTSQLSRAWDYTPPERFSAIWTGSLAVGDAGDYTFTLTADDGARLYVNQQLVVDNSGPHGPLARSGRVRLTRGSHAVALYYAQSGGGYDLAWTWARDGGPTGPVPAWRLSPRPLPLPELAAIGVVRAAWPVLTFIVLLALWRGAYVRGWWPARSAPEPAPPGLRALAVSRAGLGALVLFGALAVVETWPLAAAPGRLSRNDNADTVLNEWAMAWVGHQVVRDPLRLFDANIFHPERDALALSESLVVQGVLGAPMAALGASPVLVYNLVLLLGFALTGWAMSLVVWRWTGDAAAGLVAGVLFAFNAHTLTRLPHIQAQHAEFLPLALVALDALLRKPRWLAAIALAAAVVLQGLASVYLLVFTLLALGVAVLVRPEDWSGQRLPDVEVTLAGATLAACVVLLPLLLPYWRLHDRGFVRSLDDVARFAAVWRDYLTTPARWYPWAGGNVGLFPGAAGVGFALVALATGVAWRDARARMCVAFGVAGVVLSFGPAVVPGWETLYRAVPILPAIRTTSRFGYLGLVAIAVLAGYGVARVRTWAGRVWGRGVRGLGGVAMVLVVVVEPFSAPIGYEQFTGIDAIYRVPAGDPGAVVVELPFPPPDAPFRNAAAMLGSTLNWRPLWNGYSGFLPPSYAAHYRALAHFPDATSLAALQAGGATHLFVHVDALPSEVASGLAMDPRLTLLAQSGSLALYRLAPAR